MSLRITEIFTSIQGETTYAGLPTTFVRLTGCPLRCGYCDTEYAFHGGTRLSIAEVLEQVVASGVPYVCVTGGEPLAQPAAPELLKALCDHGFEVTLETSGALEIGKLDARVVRILDIKTPGSGEVSKNLWSNIAHLNQRDQVKFVLCDQSDYQWARMKVDEHRLTERAGEVLFSPSQGALHPAELAKWIIDDRLKVRLQLQMHKTIWGDEPGR